LTNRVFKNKHTHKKEKKEKEEDERLNSLNIARLLRFEVSVNGIVDNTLTRRIKKKRIQTNKHRLQLYIFAWMHMNLPL